MSMRDFEDLNSLGFFFIITTSTSDSESESESESEMCIEDEPRIPRTLDVTPKKSQRASHTASKREWR